MKSNNRAHLLSSSSYGFVSSHHLRIEKHVPESLEVLRKEIALPQHRDIYEAAIKEPTFEAVIGCIAAKLDIALDGDYEPDALFSLLIEALRHRFTGGIATSGLPMAELVERVDSITLEFGGVTLDGQKTTEAAEVESQRGGSTASHSRFMQQAGCDICESRSACQAAEKCLGQEAYEAGVKIEETKE